MLSLETWAKPERRYVLVVTARFLMEESGDTGVQVSSERSGQLKDVSGRSKEYGARIETDYQRVSKIVGNARTLTLSLSNGVIIPPHPCRIRVIHHFVVDSADEG